MLYAISTAPSALGGPVNPHIPITTLSILCTTAKPSFHGSGAVATFSRATKSGEAERRNSLTPLTTHLPEISALPTRKQHRPAA